MKIVIAGGTGYLGTVITTHFLNLDYEVVVLTRRESKIISTRLRFVKWDASTLGDWQYELEAVDILINLTGKSVNCRYTRQNKIDIVETRVNATRILAKAIKLRGTPPLLWLNASSATIYTDTYDTVNTEITTVSPGNFSEHVCAKWEDEFFSHELNGTRKVALRMALVLGKAGGVYPVYKALAKQGLGGAQGDGQQYVSWIHEQDLLGIINHLTAYSTIEGVLNCASPNPVTNQNFMKTIRKSLNVSFGFSPTKWMSEIGAFFMRTETELILKSRKVVSVKLRDTKFKFRYDRIEDALEGLSS